MAKKKKEQAEGTDEESGEEKKGGGKMMPAAMISIALVAAGYFVGGRGGGGTATTTVTSVVTVEEAEPEVETIIDLEPMNVNLADGHYLRIAISIGMAAEEHAAEADSGGHAAETGTDTFPVPGAQSLGPGLGVDRPLPQRGAGVGRQPARPQQRAGRPR